MFDFDQTVAGLLTLVLAGLIVVITIAVKNRNGYEPSEGEIDECSSSESYEYIYEVGDRVGIMNRNRDYEHYSPLIPGRIISRHDGVYDVQLETRNRERMRSIPERLMMSDDELMQKLAEKRRDDFRKYIADFETWWENDGMVKYTWKDESDTTRSFLPRSILNTESFQWDEPYLENNWRAERFLQKYSYDHVMGTYTQGGTSLRKVGEHGTRRRDENVNYWYALHGVGPKEVQHYDSGGRYKKVKAFDLIRREGLFAGRRGTLGPGVYHTKHAGVCKAIGGGYHESRKEFTLIRYATGPDGFKNEYNDWKNQTSYFVISLVITPSERRINDEWPKIPKCFCCGCRWPEGFTCYDWLLPEETNVLPLKLVKMDANEFADKLKQEYCNQKEGGRSTMMKGVKETPLYKKKFRAYPRTYNCCGKGRAFTNRCCA